MIEEIFSTKEDKVEQTWITNNTKADHDGSKLKMIKDKINEIIAKLNSLK